MTVVNAKRQLPDGWRWIVLRDALVALETGTRPEGGAVGITQGIPSISAEHMTKFGTLDFSAPRFVPFEFHKEMTRGHIQRDDILVVKDGATTGKVAYVGDDFPFNAAVIN